MRKSATPPIHYLRKLQRKEAKRRRKAARRRRRDRLKLIRAQLDHEELIRGLDAKGRPVVILEAPKFFGLLEQPSHRDLIHFLRRLVELTLVEDRAVCIDFRGTAKFFSDGTLLFYSELQRIRKRRPHSIGCIPPGNQVACQVLSHLNLFALMGYKKRVFSSRDDVTHWRVLEGTQADATQGVGEAIESLPRLPQNQMGKLFRSVSEALTNVTQHAYLEARQDGTGLADDRGWWMFVREEPNELSVTFCDLGLGIPYTVPKMEKHSSWFRRRLASALQAVGVNTHQDGETIQVTVAEKRSRFEADHRGNGFANMVETITNAGSGTLLIYSNRGAYTYSIHDGREQQSTHNYPESIFGTVVGWRIALPVVSA